MKMQKRRFGNPNLCEKNFGVVSIVIIIHVLFQILRITVNFQENIPIPNLLLFCFIIISVVSSLHLQSSQHFSPVSIFLIASAISELE